MLYLIPLIIEVTICPYTVLYELIWTLLCYALFRSNSNVLSLITTGACIFSSPCYDIGLPAVKVGDAREIRTQNFNIYLMSMNVEELGLILKKKKKNENTRNPW